MKKNMMMRIASVLLVAVLLSTCAISGTFAKYTSSASGTDSARVAYWGWNLDTEMELGDLFKASYGTTDINSADGKDVIAPGAGGEVEFKFAYKPNGTASAPEVEYTFEITVTESCADSIKNNANIRWYLDDSAAMTWDQLILAILSLAGTQVVELDSAETEHTNAVKYNAGEGPAAFGIGKNADADGAHTIRWEWVFDDTNDTVTTYEGNVSQDEYDTNMGNADNLDDCSIEIKIEITQVTGETTAPENTVEPLGN